MVPLASQLRFYAVIILCFIFFQLYLFSCLKDKNVPNLTSTALNILSIYKRIRNALETEAFLDTSHMYKILPVQSSKENETSFDVTYVSQCSLNKFHLIEDILHTWEGPVSVAVFTEVKNMDETIWSVSEAAHCYGRKELYISLVVPFKDVYILNEEYAIGMARKLNESELCNRRRTPTHENPRNYNWAVPYPVNLLRNVARNRSTSAYILVTDIDMLPSRDMRKMFLRYVWSRKMYPRKVAFVVPSFEMQPGTRIPQSKADIVMAIRKGDMRPFYLAPCRNCQLLTNYTKWFSYPTLPGTRALYKIEWKQPWEPFYISYRDVPTFDERFKQYGYNRISQVCQLHMEGYSFLVLDNVFLVHSGFKSVIDFHDTKQEEMTSNRRLYAQFKEEMKSKYPESRKSCDT